MTPTRFARKSDGRSASYLDQARVNAEKMATPPRSEELPVELSLVFTQWHPMYGGPNYYFHRIMDALSIQFRRVTVFVPRHNKVTLTRPTQPNVDLIELSDPLYLRNNSLRRDLFGLNVLLCARKRARDNQLAPVVYFGGGDRAIGWRSAAILGKRFGIPVIVECVLLGSDDGKAMLSGRLKALSRYAMMSVNRFSCLSTGLADSLASVGVPNERIVHNPYGINLSEFAPIKAEEKSAIRRKIGVSPKGFVGVFIGNVVSRKGVLDLVHSWVALQTSRPDQLITLLIVGPAGDPAYIGEIRSFLDSHPHGKSVIFLGLRQDIAEILKASDVYCSAAHAEGLGIATLEALASGLPVVHRYIPGVSEDLVYKDSVTVLRKWSDHDFIDAVTRLMDKTVWERVSAEARVHAETHFSLDQRIQRIKSLCGVQSLSSS